AEEDDRVVNLFAAQVVEGLQVLGQDPQRTRLGSVEKGGILVGDWVASGGIHTPSIAVSAGLFRPDPLATLRSWTKPSSSRRLTPSLRSWKRASSTSIQTNSTSNCPWAF